MVPTLNAGKIAVYGFSTVFCLIGLGIAYGAVATFQEGDTSKGIIMMVAALVFGGFGLGVFALVRAGIRRQAREEELKAANPAEPWKWKEDWLIGRVRSMDTSATKFLWGFTIIWNLMSTPMLFLLSKEVIENENYGGLIGFIFPLVGIGLLIAAVRKTVQGRKYGECLFVMDRVPGVLGGELAGTVLVPRGLPPGETVSVRLSCIKEVKSRSGKSTTTNEHVLWQQEHSAVQLSPAGQEAAQGATVRFRIPYDSSPTARIDENVRVFWKLEANAAVPGVDFATNFEVPVYLIQASSPENTEERLRSEELRTRMPVVDPADRSSVTSIPSAGGGMEFVIRPNKGGASVLPALVVMLFFGGIAVLLFYAGAPFIFPLIFGAIALLIVFLLLFGAFGESRIVIEEGHVSIRNSLFGLMRGKRRLCSSITKINVSGEGKAGKSGHYSIRLIGADGKSVSPLQSLRNRQQADWLAEELRKAMEPWRSKEPRKETSPAWPDR